MSDRINKVSELLRREISQSVLKELGGGKFFLTFTRVEPSSDLKYADVYFVTIPDEDALYVIKLLNKNISEIQQILNKRLRMKPVPKIRFHIDTSEQEAGEIDKLIGQLQ